MSGINDSNSKVLTSNQNGRNMTSCESKEKLYSMGLLKKYKQMSYLDTAKKSYRIPPELDAKNATVCH